MVSNLQDGSMMPTLFAPSKLKPNFFSTNPYGKTGHFGPRVVSSGSETNTPFEIWFVHGLTGDREKTWLHSNGTFFPQLLAHDFPEALIITWGYDANVARFDGKKLQNASSEGIHSYGQSLAFAIRNSRQGKVPLNRPIYFIAHSLGGLVVEQALLLCIGPDESLREIANATAGIMFMGTPHQGSHLAKLASALGRVIPANIRTVNQKAIEVLRTDSEVCMNLGNAFQEEAKHGKFKNVKLFSFYETVAKNGLGEMIVPEASAVLKGDFKSPIHGTHTSMTRFEGPHDDGYNKVKGQLRAWLLAEPAPPAQEKKPAKRKGKNKPASGSIVMSGAIFNGAITGSSIVASQIVASGNMYYYSGDKPEMQDNSPNGSEPEDEDEDEDTLVNEDHSAMLI